MMTRIIVVLSALCALCVLPAHAQKTKAQLATEIPLLCPANQLTGLCTVPNANQISTDIVNSIMPTAPVVSGNLACFNGTTGLLQDCGSSPGTVATLTNGTTSTVGYTSGQILASNGSKLTAYGISGSGGTVALTTSPVFVTPWIDVAMGTSLQLGTAAPLGSNTLAVGGNAFFKQTSGTTSLLIQDGFPISTGTISVSQTQMMMTDNGVPIELDSGSGGILNSGQLVLNSDGSSTFSGPLTIGNITGSAQCLHVNSVGTISGTGSDCGSGGGGGTPGGSNTQVQYNNAGVFGGITGATTNGTALTLVAPVLGTPASGTLTNATGLPIATGISGLGTGVATALAVNVGTAGAPVVNGGALGTPSSGTLTSATGLPISTGLSGLGTGVAAFLATPSSANLATAVTNETGTGLLVFNTSPTLVTPILGTPTSGTLTNATGLPIATGVSGLGTGVATALGVNLNASGGIPSPTPTRAGDVLIWTGSAWSSLAGNNSGTQFLQENASGVPSWATVSGTGTMTTQTAGIGISFSSGTTCTTTCTVNATGAPYFRVHSGINQSLTTAKAKVTFDTVDLNPSTAWSTSNHNFNPQVAGSYEVCAAVFVSAASIAAGNNVVVDISLDGLAGSGGVIQGEFFTNVPTGGTTTVFPSTGGCTIVAMNGSTDTLEVDASSTATTPVINTSTLRTFFSAHLIGP